jgi:hypothetical protein
LLFGLFFKLPVYVYSRVTSVCVGGGLYKLSCVCILQGDWFLVMIFFIQRYYHYSSNKYYTSCGTLLLVTQYLDVCGHTAAPGSTPGGWIINKTI